MARFVLIGKVDKLTLVATPPGGTPTTTGADPLPSFAGSDSEGNFKFTLPAYDPTKSNVLDAMHVGLYPLPAGGTPPAIPADPAQVVSAPHHFSAACSALTSGGTVIVDATEAPEGDYTGLLVAEYAR